MFNFLHVLISYAEDKWFVWDKARRLKNTFAVKYAIIQTYVFLVITQCIHMKKYASDQSRILVSDLS